MNPSTDTPPLNLGELLIILRRHLRLAGAIAATVFLAVVVAPRILSPPMYRAEATLSADRGLKPVSFQPDPTTGSVPEQLLNTQRELLTSRAVLADAVTMGALAGHPRYAGSSDPVEALLARLRCTVARNSWVLQVSLDDEDPVRAEAGLRSVIDAFLAHLATVSRERSDRDLGFLAGETTDAAAKLDAAREAERACRAAKAIGSTDPDNNHFTERINRLAIKQAELDDRIAAATALAAQLRLADAMTDPQARQAAYLRLDTTSKFTVIGSLQTELLQLEAQAAAMSTQLLEKHPRLIELRQHIEAKRLQLDQTMAGMRAGVDSDLAVLIDQRAGLERAMTELYGALGSYREGLVDLQRLHTETQRLEKFHQELVARQAQSAVLAGYDDRRMTVDSPPCSSPVARRPGTGPLAVLAVLAAAAAAVTTALLADVLDPRLRSAAALASLTRRPCLGVLPTVPGLPPLRDGADGPAAICEPIRSLWASVQVRLQQRDQGLVLLVASADAGDGRSAVASRLAACAALSGLRTLLVDGDLRQPSLHTLLGCEPGQGFGDLLAGIPGIAPTSTVVGNLDLLPAGSPMHNPAELLHSHCLGEWLTQARSTYDVIVLDSSPLATCSDAVLLSGHCSCLLLVGAIGHTMHADLAAALRRLEPVGERILGCVANRSSGPAGDAPAA